jgi:hypothetical protein
MVKIVADVLKDANLIGSAYSTQNTAGLFEDSGSAPSANLMFGGEKVRAYNPDRLAFDFKESGAYRLPDRLKKEAVRVVVINTLEDEPGDFLEALRRCLDKDFGLKLEVVRERNMRVISQTNLESAVRLLQKETSDLVVVFLPDENDEEEGISERTTRSQTIGRGLPCLVVHESTMNRPEAMTDVVIGLVSRANAVPFLLADPL